MCKNKSFYLIINYIYVNLFIFFTDLFIILDKAALVRMGSLIFSSLDGNPVLTQQE